MCLGIFTTPESIYYTYSTIPQVLAGSVALVGVFYVFVITRHRSDISAFGNRIADEIRENYLKENIPMLNSYYHELQNVIDSGNIDNIVGVIKTIRKDGKVCRVELKERIDTNMIKIEKRIKKYRKISRTSVNAVLFSSLTIILSIGILPFAENIEKSVLYFYSFLVFSLLIISVYKVLEITLQSFNTSFKHVINGVLKKFGVKWIHEKFERLFG